MSTKNEYKDYIGKQICIKQGWVDAGKTGIALAVCFVGQYWIGIKWDNEEDPDWHKASGLEIKAYFG
jgi:hypothetical protein